MQIKNYIALVALCACASAIAAPKGAQCVFTKSRPAGNRLAFSDLPVFEDPSKPQPMFVIKTGFTMWAVEKRGNWLRLTGSADSAPFADGAPIGWVKQADVEPQDLRNCN